MRLNPEETPTPTGSIFRHESVHWFIRKGVGTGGSAHCHGRQNQRLLWLYGAWGWREKAGNIRAWLASRAWTLEFLSRNCNSLSLHQVERPAFLSPETWQVEPLLIVYGQAWKITLDYLARSQTSPELFRLSISPCMSFGRLCLSRNYLVYLI